MLARGPAFTLLLLTDTSLLTPAKIFRDNLSPLRIAIASAAMILLAVLVVFYFQGRQADLAWNTIGVLRELSEVHYDIQAEESAQRGYLLTENERYLGTPTEALDDATALLAKLEAHVDQNTGQRERLALLGSITSAKLTELRTTIDLVRSGRKTEAMAVLNSDAGQLYMEEIDSLVLAIRAEEERLLDRRTGVRDTALVWVYILLGLAIAVLCYSLFKIYRQLSNVIGTLAVERERYREIATERQTEIERRERLEQYNDILIHHLEERNQALDRYAYTTSHDLLQPLRTINGMIDALAEDFPELVEGEPGSYLEMVSSSAVRMQTMVSTLLERSRDQSGEKAIPLDLNSLIGDIEKDLSQLVDEQSATISVAPLPFVQVQPTKVHTIFQNLISNAVKYGVSGRAPLVSIGAEPVGSPLDAEEGASTGEKLGTVSRWRLYVEDNGRGIAPDKLDRISNYGERGDSDDGDGHGIGLASVVETVESIGSRLVIESVVGEGSRFSFEVMGVDGARPG